MTDAEKYGALQTIAFGLRLVAVLGLLLGAILHALVGWWLVIAVAVVGLVIIAVMFVKANRVLDEHLRAG